jgi:hypothetical protein
MFGEAGILNSRPRMATILGLNNTVLGVIDAKDYKEFVSDLDRNKMEKKLNIIRPIILPRVQKKQFVKFSLNFFKKKHPPGTVLYKQGDKVKIVYIIVDGEVGNFYQAAKQKGNEYGDPYEEVKKQVEFQRFTDLINKGNVREDSPFCPDTKNDSELMDALSDHASKSDIWDFEKGYDQKLRDKKTQLYLRENLKYIKRYINESFPS